MIPYPAKSPWWQKLIACIFVAVALVNVYISTIFAKLIYLSASSWNVDLYKYIMPLLVCIGFGFAAAFPVYWHYREKTERINGEVVYGWLLAIIRYWLALEITAYGFSKLFHIQFANNYVRNDSLVGEMSGFVLTWNYFGHSYTMSCIIGFIQVTGSVLLLFRRTTLAGVLLLLPVMINIVLIDIFYEIPFLALLNALLYTLGLIYLFCWHWRVIWPVIAKPLLPAVRFNVVAKNGLRVLLIGSSLAFAAFMSHKAQKHPLEGKWRVKEMIRNSQPVPATDWLTDDSHWQCIYIENHKGLTCSPNPYVVENDRAQRGEYALNAAKDTITLSNLRGRTTIRAAIRHINADHMEWWYVDGRDSVKMQLYRSHHNK